MSTISKKEAMTSCGTRLKPGYRYVKGGRIVKAAAKKKTPIKKATTKKPSLKASSGRFMCARREKSGATSLYSPHSDDPSTACPMGGRYTYVEFKTKAALLGVKKKPANKKK